MSKITPFRAWRYNPKKVNDFSKVVAPPYDVISPELKKQLYSKSPQNITWLDLPEEKEGKGRYEVAAEIFEQWKKDEVLQQDAQPSLYLYFQSFKLPDGQERTRRGFFARRRLETFQEGGIKPHERTFSGPKEDRLKLMKATQAHLSPIFVLYGDPKNEVGPQLEQASQGQPDIDITDENGVRHRLWTLSQEVPIHRLLQTVHDRPLLIADGHHRYETAVNYAQERRAALGDQYTGEESFNFVLMYLCSLDDPGLVVLPTHRVLNERPEGELSLIRGLLEKVAAIKSFPVAEREQAMAFLGAQSEREHAIGWAHDGVIDVLTFDVEKALQSEALSHMHFALRDLDVTLLHDLVLEEIMGISKGAQREYGKISYVQDVGDVLKRVEDKNTFAFLLNPTKIKQIEAITDIGEVMPQKSTFFYPKLLTGLLMYDLR